MKPLTRNVWNIDPCDRKVLERVLGQTLREDQQLVIHIVNVNVSPEPALASVDQQGSKSQLPDWCNVYEGMSNSEIQDFESIILTRADLSRIAE